MFVRSGCAVLCEVAGWGLVVEGERGIFVLVFNVCENYLIKTFFESIG